MLFTRKALTALIVPLLIEQALGVLVGMVDSVMVSSVGEAAVSGVSLVGTLNLLLVYVFTALASGGAVIVSQLVGKKDYTRANEAAKQLVWAVMIISTFIGLASAIFRWPLLKLVFGKVDSDVMYHAQIYFFFMALSFPFLGVRGAFGAVLRASGDTKTSMRASLYVNLINVVGNALLIYVFNLEAAGAAIATLFSRIVGAFSLLPAVKDKTRIVFIDKLFKYKPDFMYIKGICGIGLPNGLENGMFQFGKVLTQSLISGLGTACIAANAVSNSLTSLQYIPGTAISAAMITVVGQCLGAQEKEQAKIYAKKLLRIAYCCIIGISIIMCLFANTLVGLYNLSPEAHKLGVNILYLHSIIVCSIWPIAFTLPNSFRAASDVRFTMYVSITSMWLFRVGLSYVFVLALDLSVVGVWYAMACDWVFRAIIFGTRYLKGTWLTKYKPLKTSKKEAA